MTADPLRSAMGIGSVGETSLALPSDNKLRTGQQRVLDQVHTIKRSKSKPQGQNGSLSPSSPNQLSVFAEFGSFKFAPSKANGSISQLGNYNTLNTSVHKRATYQKARSVSCKTMGRRIATASSGQWDQRFSTSNWPSPPNGLKPSRSDPALAGAPLVAMPPLAPLSPVVPASPAVMSPVAGPAVALLMRSKQSSSSKQSAMQSSETRYSSYTMTNGAAVQAVSAPTKSSGRPPSVLSMAKTIKTEPQSVNMSDLSLKEAVEFLSHAEENYQLCGASFIQHATFKEEPPKEEVLELGGIPLLVALLQSPNADVSQSASAALRNLVFRNQTNKLEVQQAGGIASALKLLKETDSTETQRQLTGLLWNLSSADELKEELIASALPVLTESVVVPFTCWSDSSANNNIHPDVYFSATGCLRNLSCAQMKERQAMRVCRGLIDSIMSYVESCVAEENPDDKSVENCACILHNLTYQLEVESPECFAKYYPPEDTGAGLVKKTLGTVGCFSAKSSKIPKEIKVDLEDPEDTKNPTGVNWLCHPKALKTYLTLIGSSQKDATLEACCGALQNLTATHGPGSNAMSQVMVQKLGAMHYITPLIQSPNQGLQKTAMSLMGNLSRTGSLQLSLARQLLPDLATRLSAGAKEMGKSDDTIAATCYTVRSLLHVDLEVSRKIITNELVTKLTDISGNETYPKGSKAAALLLYSIWHEKSLQGTLKKLGMAKALFVNDATTAAHKSIQVIE